MYVYHGSSTSHKIKQMELVLWFVFYCQSVFMMLLVVNKLDSAIMSQPECLCIGSLGTVVGSSYSELLDVIVQIFRTVIVIVTLLFKHSKSYNYLSFVTFSLACMIFYVF